MSEPAGYRILVIDDNPAIHDDFRKVLVAAARADDAQIAALEAALFGEQQATVELPQFELDSAYQGADGLRLVQDALRDGRPYAMAFVDVRMPPGWDGIETIERIWAIHPELEVAICTAYSDYSWAEMMARLGHSDRLLILKKPFDNVEVRQLASCLTVKWALGRQVRHQLDHLQQLVQERTRNLEASNARLQQEILQHERAEAAVAQLSHRLKLILNSAGEGICGVDGEGRAIFVNPAAAQMLGYQPGELIGAPLDTITQPAPSALPAIATTCRTGVSSRADDAVFRRQDGTTLPVEYVTTPIHDGEQIVGAVMTFRDITEKKLAQAQLQRGKELAEAATRAKSEFIANMSHEMRTPMNAILGFTEIALETTESAEQRECLKTVRTAGGALLGIIDEILDLSKVEAGKLELDCVPFTLRDTAGEALRTLAVRAEEKHLALTMEVSPEVPDVLIGDPARLRQILVNLVGNAVKFTERGTVALRITADATPPGGCPVLRCAVSDTGIGIAPDKLELIFQPFSQADGSMSRCYGGTGLGLSIATRFVELMGGRIWVESQLGVGSTFYFTARVRLPVDTDPPVGPHAARRDLRIALVDDDCHAGDPD